MSIEWVLLIFLLRNIACIFIGVKIGKYKGFAVAGGALGFFLGVLGLLIVSFLPEDKAVVEAMAIRDEVKRKCPFCEELVKVDARVCKHCGKDLPPAVPKAAEQIPEGEAWTCSKCGKPNLLRDGVCQSCGNLRFG